MFEVSFGKYKVLYQMNELPSLFHEYVEGARLAEKFDLSESEGSICFFAVGESFSMPVLVIAQRCIPGEELYSHPGALIVPETDILFIGGGRRVLAYDLAGPSRIWEDTADAGFQGWDRFGDFVLMSAELELAAWDIHAKKLWSTFVETWWSYTVAENTVHLDVMGEKYEFPLDVGPGEKPPWKKW
ncbi:MAG: hypothetical protein KC964_11105 [Candidatus Omnitrophica bacterium]|nr:hypothetical protein [Candidatus Omnitrophota bacterium]